MKAMAKNKTIPDALLSRLHGKGSMSEILNIERDRLLLHSRQAMQHEVDTGAAHQAAPGIGDNSAPVSALPDAPFVRLPAQPNDRPAAATPPVAAAAPTPIVEMSALPAANAVESVQASGTGSVAAGLQQETSPTNLRGASDFAAPIHPPMSGVVHMEGFSARSRVVGDDFSEFGRIVTHTAITVAALPKPASPDGEAYYAQTVDLALPFTAERNLLRAIRRLTLDWGTLSCQITLELLSLVSGIRNLKTIRKWLADLHDRGHIRYTPVHGDLRGSIITLNPPPSVLSSIERSWHGLAGMRGSGTALGNPATTPKS